MRIYLKKILPCVSSLTNMWKYLCLFLLFPPFFLIAQNDFVVVESIQIEGNKHTKERTILREIPFRIGDSIPVTDLADRLEESRLLILNTGLFTLAKFNVKEWDQENNKVKLLLELQEGWYIFPIPIFELADRNFNVWWEEQNRSLDRVNFGLRFYHINLSGNRDRLKLVTQFGYTQKFELDYTFPSLNKKQNLGFNFNAFYARNKEIAYKTIDNKLQFARFDGKFLLQRFRIGGALLYRPKIRSYHNFKLEFQQNTIDDFVKQDTVNIDYFLGNATRQRLFYLRYDFTYDTRDIKPYPLSGNQLYVVLEKEGLGIFKERNGLYLTAEYSKYFPLSKKFSFASLVKGRTALIRNEQPYNNYWALGYGGDFVRGYEFYVIDGLDYAFLKSTLRYELLNIEFNWGKYMPIQQFKIMPLKMYLTSYFDTGYVNDTQFTENNNTLGNTWLKGGGLGVNFVVYYDKVIVFEYSWNHLKEKGLFLSFNLSI